MSRFYRSNPSRIVALLTDFGFKDSYVGVMKGVILRYAKSARIIDLCHNVLPQDVVEAAFVLSCSYNYFPEETIFACVVDPGVGSDRRILCMETPKYFFLAPDNGLLSVLEGKEKSRKFYEVTNDEFFLKPVSATFHGRDVFAPVAGHLARGLDPSRLGPVTKRVATIDLDFPIRTPDGTLRGQVIYIDQFGNVITNITETALTGNQIVDRKAAVIVLQGHRIHGIAHTYADLAEGEIGCLMGSSGYLEISANRGSAQGRLQVNRGDDVIVTRAE